jgi:hypothetical protein
LATNQKKFFLSLVALIAVGLALLGILTMLNRHPQVVGLNQEIQYDDFAFAALGVRQVAVVGNVPNQRQAQGIYAVVTMRVANYAKRVDFTFDKSTVVLLDEQGHEYHWSADAQRAFDATRSADQTCAEPIPAGAACVTEVVIDVPATARITQLRISSGSVGDALDTIFYGRKRIVLPSQ